MPPLVEKVEIKRISQNGRWRKLAMYYVDYDYLTGFERSTKNGKKTNRNEEDATVSLLDNFERGFTSYRCLYFLRNINLDQLRSDVLQGFHQLRLRENDLSSNSYYSQDTMEISLVAECYLSCKKNKTQSSGENRILQSEIQQKLATVGKDSKVMKFFEDNKCCVCLSTYKEILDNDLHIVVPSCGHPLCCECAYNILASEKKECPRCRGNLTAKSFNLMKFNADLGVETQDQRVFL